MLAAASHMLMALRGNDATVPLFAFDFFDSCGRRE